jgi:hypothetical protein
MLILTTNACRPDPQAITVPLWSGPLVLVVLPGSGLGKATIEALNERFIILEFLQPPAGAAALFADIAGWLGHLLRRLDGPLLFLDQPLDTERLAAEAVLGADQPEQIRAELDAQGRLTLLRLGEMVASSPLLPGFFGFLEGRTVDDTLFVDLLTHAFASEST